MYRVALTKSCRTPLQKALQENLSRHYSSNGRLPSNLQEAGFGKVLFFLSPFVAIGGAVTYAKHDKDFRKKLEDNVPGAASLIKIALQEEKPFQGVSKQIDNVTKSFEGVTSTVTGFFGKDSEKKSEGSPTKPAASAKPDSPSKTAKAASTENKPTAKATATPVPAKPKAPEPLPNDILELEKAVEVAAALAVKEYNKAIATLKSFNEDVRKVVDHAVENMDTSHWTTLRNKTSARDTSVETAEKMAREAADKIERCEVALSKAADPKNHDQIMEIRDKIKKLVDHINTVKDELYRHKDMASLSEKYWKNVEKARHYFVEEIESIFPGLNLAEKKLNLSKEDLDLFITHAYSHVAAYQKELQRLQTEGELRLKRAIDALRGDSDSEAVKSQIEYLMEAEKRKIAIENQKKILQIRADAEKSLRMQLKKQAEAHVDHLNEVVALKESELKRNYARELEDKLETEKANYKLQLASMSGKMRGMDAALKARAEAERSAHQAQALWAACQALWATVRTGEPGVHWKNKLRPLKREMRAISKVSEGDELVAVVLNSLPHEAEERGVFPEDALRERFLNVERVARKVALVSDSGASLPMYFLSYLQSIFIMSPASPISEDELQNKLFDFSKLDTYDILNRARYFVDRGDLMSALKYMNLLRGASRYVASDWLKECRLLLETQQVANTLMAHAAASGLLYL